MRVIGVVVLPVVPVLHARPPLGVVAVPEDGLADALLERDLGFPAELGADLGGIDEVAAVVDS